MKCSVCGRESQDNALYCCYCGSKMTEAAAVDPEKESASACENSRETEMAGTVRPLSDNPYQPRRMPTIYSEGFVPPIKDIPAAEHPAVQAAAHPAAEQPVLKRPSTKKVFLFDDEEEEEQQKKEKELERKLEEDPFYGADDGLDDDDDDDDDDEALLQRRRVWTTAIIALVTVLILCVASYAFLFYTSVGCRLRAYYGFSASADDYVCLADWQFDKGNSVDASASYYTAFRLNPDDYAFSLKIAQDFERCSDFEHAEQLYLYLIDKHPEADEAFDYLMSLLVREGKIDQYNALIAYRAEKQPGYTASDIAVNPPSAQPQEGSYSGSVRVELTAAEGAAIYFTVDGSEPTVQSSRYNGPIALYAGNYTLKAIAVINGNTSGVTTASYTVR